eukprot:CAMPEP_0196995022 /NCGR_PEP_ID=MMETSP1380-20130617/1220_1 /TAXON_ID=5936 /ORGANISM="Euplotes crassus, Strain CT5" /LENGTH=58 /DNA_ID=CAMNT_0042410569 /DNA_START=175 /DNA_END=351 /DNA_ORIENTATION=-
MMAESSSETKLVFYTPSATDSTKVMSGFRLSPTLHANESWLWDYMTTKSMCTMRMTSG